MPYDIAKDFEGCAYAVVKTAAGKRELAPGGCHDSATAAGRHLAALQAATEGEYRAEDGYAPNAAMRAEAARGLEWRREHNRGGTEVGVARARDIVNGRRLSLDTVNRMVSYFARHEVDKEGQGWSEGEAGYPSAGRIAWALWGGNPGRTWANAIADSKRHLDFDYEFRHPGHADQSVHDPHKHHGYKIGSSKAATSEQAAGRVMAAREAFAAGGGTLITNPTEKQIVQARKDVKAAREVLFAKQKEGTFTAEDKTAMDGLSLSQHAISHAENGGTGTLTLAYTKGPNGKPVIAGTMLTVTTGANEVGVMFIGSTGAAKGAGSTMMHSAMKSASTSGKPFVVKSPDDKAIPFYKALGLAEAKGDRMNISTANLNKFVKLVGD